MDDRRPRLGARGEQAAAQWYVAHGCEVLSTNWRCREGEIDLVVMGPDRATLIICEVKTRLTTRFGSPFEAVTTAKQRKLRRLAGRYLAQRRSSGDGGARIIRFDVAGVTGDGHGGLHVEVMQDAFS